MLQHCCDFLAMTAGDRTGTTARGQCAQGARALASCDSPSSQRPAEVRRGVVMAHRQEDVWVTQQTAPGRHEPRRRR
jgi:hypothetical protein